MADAKPPTAQADRPPKPVVDHVDDKAPKVQVTGPKRGDQKEFIKREHTLHSDRVITDHNDPLGTKYQFLGQEDPAPPLPIGGAGNDPRTPDEVFADGGK